MIDLSSLYLPNKKKLYNYDFFKKINFFFLINMGIRTMVIYFAYWLMIIKNIYSDNDYLLELLLLKVIFS